MALNNADLKTINDAFLLLPEEVQAHSLRVQAYVDAAFRKLVTMDLYISDSRSSVELQIENIRSFVTGALYHDIGKLLEDADELDEDGKTVHKEHCLHGDEIARELPPAEGRFQPTERRIYLSCIREHHEYVSGGGEPTGKALAELAFGGRLVAIADRLDHLAMGLRVEDPISKALTLLKEEVKEGHLDPEFYKAFRAVKTKLKKAFEPYRESASAVPETIPWIQRKANRPMELFYFDRQLGNGSPEVTVREASMRFKNRTEEPLRYEDLKTRINEAKLGPELGRYFTYELLDAVRRFETLSAGTALYALELPPAWYGDARLAEETLRALRNEKLDPAKLILILPDQMTKPQENSFGKHEGALKEAGIGIFRRSAWDALVINPEAPGRFEDEIIETALKETEPEPPEGGDAG